jgi:hypothetical protein
MEYQVKRKDEWVLRSHAENYYAFRDGETHISWYGFLSSSNQHLTRQFTTSKLVP